MLIKPTITKDVIVRVLATICVVAVAVAVPYILTTHDFQAHQAALFRINSLFVFLGVVSFSLVFILAGLKPIDDFLLRHNRGEKVNSDDVKKIFHRAQRFPVRFALFSLLQIIGFYLLAQCSHRLFAPLRTINYVTGITMGVQLGCLAALAFYFISEYSLRSLCKLTYDLCPVKPQFRRIGFLQKLIVMNFVLLLFSQSFIGVIMYNKARSSLRDSGLKVMKEKLNVLSAALAGDVAISNGLLDMAKMGKL